jgi:hypothetical protein
MAWTVAIGVDTHRDVHVAVALDRLGARLDSREIETLRRATAPCFAGRWTSAPRYSLLRVPRQLRTAYCSSSTPARLARGAKRVGMAPDRPPIERELLAEEQPTWRVLAGRR